MQLLNELQFFFLSCLCLLRFHQAHDVHKSFLDVMEAIDDAYRTAARDKGGLTKEGFGKLQSRINSAVR